MIPAAISFAGELEDLPEIPQFVHDRFGNLVEIRDDEIQLHDPVKNCVLRLRRFPEGNIRYAMQYRIAHSVGVYAATAVLAEVDAIMYLLEDAVTPLSLEEMTIGWWRKTRTDLQGKSEEHKLSRLRMWYVWLDDEGFPGVDTDVANEIDEWRIPGMVKGEAVRSRDSERGPLTWGQFAHLITKLTNVAKSGATAELAATKLCVNLGLNARQLALLEERDLTSFTDPDTGERDFFLDVPRMKKRLAKRETKRRSIQPETGEILEKLILKNQEHRDFVPWEQTGKMPIFCRSKPKEYPASSPLSQRFEWHVTSRLIHHLVRSFSELYELRFSDGDRFYLSPRRIRYTFATMLAATGAPPRSIAEALDHTDLQHVGVYVQATGKLADRLNKAIGRHLEPWVKRFIEGPPESLVSDSSRVIYHPDPTQHLLIGYCGLHSRCHDFPPDSCYGCDLFHPWRDADHSSVLGRLEARKAKLMADRGNASDRIPHQLDVAIENAKLVVAAQKIAQERQT
jgi:integrase